MPHPLLDKHRATLDSALNAIATRGYWSPFPEMPSPKLYGETAPDEGKRAFEAHLGKQFELGQPGQTGWHDGESSPYGVELGVSYPTARARLEQLWDQLGYQKPDGDPPESAEDIVAQLKSGEIGIEEAESRLRQRRG